MKTENAKKARREKRSVAIDNEIFYVTLPSTMNYHQDSEEDENEFGYPDFYEDTDNMNRYLW
ncbi:hypothetical protein HUK80_12905 [Flavobacterium sp. MAH-1]|uniref:Uncharacterized protein n=1 Tax=Flavobacterium agri TaxID=2743471 RepID=A0A7Y9C6V6_9FLAO|nr:hypothetical protein [Flavobacterium agri]NUY81800.1 hypothetical protein [Flavobacterium agri]NYA71824.1 hypothetical protein [Flavobacterium agri]